MDYKEKQSDFDDLCLSVARLVKICEMIIEECDRNNVESTQLKSAVSSVELYMNKMRS